MRRCSLGPAAAAGARSRPWWRKWRLDRTCRPLSGSFQPLRHRYRRSPPQPRRHQRLKSSRPPSSLLNRRLRSAPAALPVTRRPIVEATSPERYRVQFTIGKERHDRLRRVQALLRREIPNGDPGAIFDRAIALLLERVEKEKLGAATKPRAPRAIRPGTDSPVSSGPLTSRHTPSHVKRSAWQHDGGQCAFVSKDGRRCTDRAFLEFHHIRPYALRGASSTENISLRCRRHNQYEAELVFGPRTRGNDGDSGVSRQMVAARTRAMLFANPADR
jgi:hypothetical protein